MLERGYDAMRAYTQSKLAQIVFTFELAGRLQDTGVTVNALHPASLMDTKMVWGNFGYTMSTVEEGAEAVVRLAVSPELEGVTGRYFDGTREGGAREQASLRPMGQEEAVGLERGSVRALARPRCAPVINACLRVVSKARSWGQVPAPSEAYCRPQREKRRSKSAFRNPIATRSGVSGG